MLTETLPREHSLPVDRTQVDNLLSAPSGEVIDAMGRITGDVLVLGAGGKMGLHVCRMLAAADAANGVKPRVTAVSRFGSAGSRDGFDVDGIRTLACDLESEEALAALPEAENVIFMAGAKFGTGDQPDLLRRMNVELPHRVAERFGGSRCLVFSTGCVYSMVTPTSGGSSEADATNPPSDYAQSCLERELAFRAAARDHGSRVALIRLNYATEFRYGVLVDIATKVANGEPVNLDMGWVNVIWQRDAVDHILRALPLAASEPLVLNVAGEEVLSVRDLAERFGDRMGKTVSFTGDAGETAWLNDASKSHGLFGKPPTSLEQMIEWTSDWVLGGGDLLGKPTGFEKRSGKF